MEYNCALIKVDWLAACIALRVVGAVHVMVIFLRRWCKNLHNPPANMKQGPIPEEMSQNWPCPLFRPKTDHVCHQKPNPSRETGPLNPLDTVVHQNPELPFFC